VQIGGASVTAPSERLIRRIRRDFPRGTDDEVIVRLTALRPDDSSERLQAALVLGAAGKWNRFEQQLRRLERDWRDVLVAGGLADEDWPARLAEALPCVPAPEPATGQADGPRTEQLRPAHRDASAPRRVVTRKPYRAR
jgi:hypothetical protein